ncbi:beta-defensin 1 [Myotis lucifugus]|uniref:beta-defensin 1 n=1 Tax=Myotis lucifugus TaxID=59463 RepID=UPI0006D712D1|nr:beta-defensin 1 [Myotis lucifugus]
MRLLHILLLPLCLLFAQVGPGAGLLMSLGKKVEKKKESQEDKCVLMGGVCSFIRCSQPSQNVGYCYQGRARCCLRD